MAQTQTENAPTVAEPFKRLYGQKKNLPPDNNPVAKMIPWDHKARTGKYYSESFSLTNETGWTMSNSDLSFRLKPARAGAIQQTEIKASTIVLTSKLPWTMVSRTKGAGDLAFFDMSKHIVKANIRSHNRLQEINRLYGQSPEKLGRVAYFDGTYRNASFTDGTGTLVDRYGVSRTFTNGVNEASKLILLHKGDWAPGIFCAMEGCAIHQIDSAGSIVASGSLVSVDPELGFIEVDFVPVKPTAATGSGSVRLCFDGMEDDQEMLGIHGILSSQGKLFGIDRKKYSLWQSNYKSLGNKKMLMDSFQEGAAVLKNRGGNDSDIVVMTNPYNVAPLISEQQNLVRHGANKMEMYHSGANGVEFYSMNGKVTFVAHPMVRERHAFALSPDSWTRAGSAEVGFEVPGREDGQLIKSMDEWSAYVFHSYSDEFIFCRAPADQMFYDNIDFEATA